MTTPQRLIVAAYVLGMAVIVGVLAYWFASSVPLT